MEPSTVDALLPLSLLEAVRAIDTPQGDHDAEYVAELRNKKLGLSDTVYAQIRRYNDAVKRSQRIPLDEALALARLVGRRPDAEDVFRTGGRFLAGRSYATLSPVSRKLMRTLPSVFSRPLALRRMRRLADRYLNGAVSRLATSVLLDVPVSVTAASAPRQVGCSYYEAALRELLQLLVGGSGAVEHVRCLTRGEGSCEWRAEWRSVRGGA